MFGLLQPDKVKVGQRIKEIKESMNLSFTELGNRLGIKKPTISSYVQGYALAPESVINQLSSISGKPVGWFYFGDIEEYIADYLQLKGQNRIVQEHPEVAESMPIKDSFKALKGNWPWVIIVSSFIFYWLGNSTRTSSLIYYARYNLENVHYVSVLNGLVLTQMIGIALIPFLVRRYSKTTTMIIGLLLAAVGQIGLGLAGGNFPLLVITWILTSIGTGIAVSMPFAMLSDTVDYGEYKNGIRASGFLTAVGSAVGIQVGTGVGDFVPLKLMEAFGYVANQDQTSSALSAIKFGFSYLPAIFFVCGAIIMLTYSRYEKRESHVLETLQHRRASGKKT